MAKDVLVVDCDHRMLRVLRRVLAFQATVDLCPDFAGARARLVARAPDLLVTNIRLREYNGLHLVYLAAALALRTRAVVYDESVDPGLVREVQTAGAFYVPHPLMNAALPAYLGATLPPHDRRDAADPDRRHLFRGGRRVTDAEANDLAVNSG